MQPDTSYNKSEHSNKRIIKMVTAIFVRIFNYNNFEGESAAYG